MAQIARLWVCVGRSFYDRHEHAFPTSEAGSTDRDKSKVLEALNFGRAGSSVVLRGSTGRWPSGNEGPYRDSNFAPFKLFVSLGHLVPSEFFRCTSLTFLLPFLIHFLPITYDMGKFVIELL